MQYTLSITLGGCLAIMTVSGATPIASASGDATGLPAVRLSAHLYPEGITAEDAYTNWMRERTVRAIAEADKTTDPLQRITFRLAAANAMLAAQAEPALSRWLQGVSDDSDRTWILDLAEHARKLLAQVRGELGDYRDLPDHDNAAADDLMSAVEVLRGFADAFAACVRSGDDAATVEARKEAARTLSEYLEHNKPQVAASAMLWQSALYGLLDRVDRAMLLLPLPAEPPRNDTMHTDFFAKLLRCRFLARRGGYAAAWDLLSTMEERSRTWFVAASSRSEAARSAMLVKFDICRQWEMASEGPTRDATTAWCDKALAEIRHEHFSADEQPAVMRLSTTAPLMVPIPDTPPPAPDEVKIPDAWPPDSLPDQPPEQRDDKDDDSPQEQP